MSELSQWLYRDDSIVNIVPGIIVINITHAERGEWCSLPSVSMNICLHFTDEKLKVFWPNLVGSCYLATLRAPFILKVIGQGHRVKRLITFIHQPGKHLYRVPCLSLLSSVSHWRTCHETVPFLYYQNRIPSYRVLCSYYNIILVIIRIGGIVMYVIWLYCMAFDVVYLWLLLTFLADNLVNNMCWCSWLVLQWNSFYTVFSFEYAVIGKVVYNCVSHICLLCLSRCWHEF